MANSGYAGIINTDQNTGDFVFDIAASANTGSDLPVSLSEIMRITKRRKSGYRNKQSNLPLISKRPNTGEGNSGRNRWSDYVFDKIISSVH
jgi:hypothetical protein